MNVILLANWGLGLEILKTLHELPAISIKKVVTGYEPATADPWRNAVYDFARQQDYPTFDQKELDWQELAGEIRSNDIDLLVVHAYMRKIPREAYAAPRLGSINVHASLLPRHRGPAPTYWVLKNREQVTGLTCHYIGEDYDCGAIITQVTVPVLPEDDLASVIERQKLVVKELLSEALKRINDPNFKPALQDEALATYAPRPI